jgi:hypothetical protein
MGKFRTVLFALAAGGLVIAQPALASATRSANALPSTGVAAPAQSVARGSQPAESTSEIISPAWIALIAAFLGGLAFLVADSGGSKDSPG